MSLISFNLFNELFESKDGQKTIVYKLVWWVHIVFSFWFYQGSKVISFIIHCVHNIFLFFKQNIIHTAPREKDTKIMDATGLREFVISNSWPTIHYNPSPFVIIYGIFISLCDLCHWLVRSDQLRSNNQSFFFKRKIIVLPPPQIDFQCFLYQPIHQTCQTLFF